MYNAAALLSIHGRIYWLTITDSAHALPRPATHLACFNASHLRSRTTTASLLRNTRASPRISCARWDTIALGVQHNNVLHAYAGAPPTAPPYGCCHRPALNKRVAGRTYSVVSGLSRATVKTMLCADNSQQATSRGWHVREDSPALRVVARQHPPTPPTP